MKLVTYRSDRGPRVAGIRDGRYVDLNGADPAVPACIKALLAQGAEGLARAADALSAGDPLPDERPELLPPIPSPEKIICIDNFGALIYDSRPFSVMKIFTLSSSASLTFFTRPIFSILFIRPKTECGSLTFQFAISAIVTPLFSLCSI